MPYFRIAGCYTTGGTSIDTFNEWGQAHYATLLDLLRACIDNIPARARVSRTFTIVMYDREDDLETDTFAEVIARFSVNVDPNCGTTIHDRSGQIILWETILRAAAPRPPAPDAQPVESSVVGPSVYELLRRPQV